MPAPVIQVFTPARTLTNNAQAACTATTTGHSILVVAASWSSSAVTWAAANCTDSAGNTYVLRHSVNGPSNGVGIALFDCLSPASTGVVWVKVTNANAQEMSVSGYEIGGATYNTGSQSSTSSTLTPTTPSITPSSTATLAVAVMTSQVSPTSNDLTFTSGGGANWPNTDGADQTENNNFVALSTRYRVTSVASTAMTESWTIGAGTAAAVNRTIIASYVSSAAATPQTVTAGAIATAESVYAPIVALSGSATTLAPGFISSAQSVPNPTASVGSVPGTVISSGSAAQMGTTLTADLAGYGFTWAQGHPLVVDQYGKLIATTRNQSGTSKLHFVYSNDGGTTWNDPSDLNQFALERGSAAYDSVHDLLHVLWMAQDPADGMIYRRYTISRDGSHNITAFARDTAVNLQLDFGATIYTHPVLLWIPEGGSHGSVVCCWGAATGSGHEVRASMRTLSNSSADSTAANWIAPVTADTTGIGNAPQVAYSKLASGTTNSPPWPSLGRKSGGSHAKDLYLCYAHLASVWEWRWRRYAWNSGTNAWDVPTGLPTDVLISNMVRAGTDTTGYNAKYQHGSEPREDAAGDRMVFGFSTYKDNTDRDTWSYVGIGAGDLLSSIVDVYVGGGNSNHVDKLIAGDVVCDAGRVLASYTDLPSKAIFVRSFDASGTEVQAPLGLAAYWPAFVPTLWQSGASARYARSGSDYLLLLARDFNTPGSTQTPPTYTPPYHGYFGTYTVVPTISGTLVQPGSIGTAEAVFSPTVSLRVLPDVITTAQSVFNPTIAGTVNTHSIAAGAGYSDAQPKQLARTSSNRLYAVVPQCSTYPFSTSDHFTVFKANATGTPTAFTAFVQTDTNISATAVACQPDDNLAVIYAKRDGTLSFRVWNTTSDTWVAAAQSIASGIVSSGTDGINGYTGQGAPPASLALDASGDAHVAYLASDGTRARLYYRNRIGGSWSSATQVDSDVTYSGNLKAWQPSIAFDTVGRVVVVWVRGSFNDTNDGGNAGIFVRTRETSGTWNASADASGIGGGLFSAGIEPQVVVTWHNALTSIDQSACLLITSTPPANRYHLSWLQVGGGHSVGSSSRDVQHEYIGYAYSDDHGATWSFQPPGGGVQNTHNPTLGPGNGGSIRIYGHGAVDSGNHGNNLYYFEGPGGGASWSSWTLYQNGADFDSSVATRWSQYFFNHPEAADVAYWNDTYPNDLFVGTETITLATITLAPGAITSGQAVYAPSVSMGPPGGLSSPSLIKQAGAPLTNLSPDGFTWAQAPAIAIDAFGKLVGIINDHAQQCHFLFSNDGGATWNTPSANIDGGFLTRGSVAVDASGSWAHVLWAGTTATDGIIYRRYAITRDGAHNITAISNSRDAAVNLQLDLQSGAATMNYEQPVLLWIPEGGANGSVVALWGAQNAQAGHVGSEVRCAMRRLSLSSADATAANWTAPGVVATDSIGNPPNVGSYTAVSQLANAGFAPGVAMTRKRIGTNALDLYVFYAEGLGAATATCKFRRMRWSSGASNWSTLTTAATTLASLVRAGSDVGGYNLKFELLTEPREDTARDRIWLGLCTYKDATNRDTWGYAGVDCSSDTVIPLVDVYSAGSHMDNQGGWANKKFVSGDISVDSITGWVATTWVDLPAKHIYAACYDSIGAQLTAPVLVSSGAPFDTPTLVNGRMNQAGTPSLVIAVRDFNTTAASADGVEPTYTPPYVGWLGRLVWAPAGASLIPNPIASGETVYPPTINAGIVPQTLVPNGIGTAEAVFDAAARLQVLAAGIASAELVYPPSVSMAAVPGFVGPNLIPSAEAVYPPFVQASLLASPNPIASAETVYTPTVGVAQLVLPGGIASGESVYTPLRVVFTMPPLLPLGIPSAAAVFDPSLAVGPSRPPPLPLIVVYAAPAALVGQALGFTEDDNA